MASGSRTIPPRWVPVARSPRGDPGCTAGIQFAGPATYGDGGVGPLRNVQHRAYVG